MRRLDVRLGRAGHPVLVGRGLLRRAGEWFRLDRRCLVVTDDGVPGEYAAAVAGQCAAPVVAVVPRGEGSKSPEQWLGLLRRMKEARFDRGDCVVAVGGGVVGDLAGFAAAAYMRGIDFYNVPTTLLAQVDASVGGKTGLNLDGTKNAVGAFHQPRGVVVDPDTLATLPPRLLAEGMAEAVKMALAFDADFFARLEAERAAAFAGEAAERTIARALEIKIGVVERDEREGGLRRALNLGHTLGHGIESERKGTLFHGECVALGMLPMCAPEVRARLKSLLERLGLPTRYGGDREAALAAVRSDKKFAGDRVAAVRVPEAGRFEFVDESMEDLRRDLALLEGEAE